MGVVKIVGSHRNQARSSKIGPQCVRNRTVMAVDGIDDLFGIRRTHHDRDDGRVAQGEGECGVRQCHAVAFAD